MSNRGKRTSLSTVEELVVEHTLGALSRTSTLARIQQLTAERQKLYAQSAAHPFLAPANARRIRAIGVEVDFLWDTLRRERAHQRVRLERALNVEVDVEPERIEDVEDQKNGSIDAA